MFDYHPSLPSNPLAKIWAMKGKCCGDLRTAPDAMAANDTLLIHRGDRTVFVLTESSAATVAQPTRDVQ